MTLECCVCGKTLTKETIKSKCDWSMLGNHHPIDSLTKKDRYGVEQ